MPVSGPEWAAWSTTPDPAKICRPLVNPPSDHDLARVLVGAMTKLAATAIESERVADFFRRRDESATEILWKLIALDQLDLGPTFPPGAAMEQVVSQAAAWGGDEWADAVLDSWTAIGHARSVRERLGRGTGPADGDALAAAIVDHGAGLVNWSFAMVCASVLFQRQAAAGSEEVLTAVRTLLIESGQRAYTSLRSFELAVVDAREQGTLFPTELSDEELALEDEAQREGEMALRGGDQG